MNELLQLDLQLFEWINQDLQNGLLDWVMPWWRDKKTWIPFYVLLAGFLAFRYRWKFLPYLLAVSLLVGLSDTLSSKVVKPAVERLRPCNDPAVQDEVMLRAGCGSGYSFTSSHATNHFAIALFWIFTLPFLGRWGKWALGLWAASIAFGQVYVGVHYPLDVVAGSLLGCLIGVAVVGLYRLLPAAYRISN